MKRIIQRGVAIGFLSLAVFGGTASAAWCGKPCESIYRNCMSAGGNPDICQAKYDQCLESLCGI